MPQLILKAPNSHELFFFNRRIQRVIIINLNVQIFLNNTIRVQCIYMLVHFCSLIISKITI